MKKIASPLLPDADHLEKPYMDRSVRGARTWIDYFSIPVSVAVSERTVAPRRLVQVILQTQRGEIT